MRCRGHEKEGGNGKEPPAVRGGHGAGHAPCRTLEQANNGAGCTPSCWRHRAGDARCHTARRNPSDPPPKGRRGRVPCSVPHYAFALVRAEPLRMPHHGTPCGGSLSVPWRHSTACSPRAPSPLKYTTAPAQRQGRCKCPSGTLAAVRVPWCGGNARAFTRPSPVGTAVPSGSLCARHPRRARGSRPPSRSRPRSVETVPPAAPSFSGNWRGCGGCGTAVPLGTRTAVREQGGKQGGRHRTAPSAHAPAFRRIRRSKGRCKCPSGTLDSVGRRLSGSCGSPSDPADKWQKPTKNMQLHRKTAEKGVDKRGKRWYFMHG